MCDRSFVMSECVKIWEKIGTLKIALFPHFKKIAQLRFQNGRKCDNVRKKWEFQNRTFFAL